MSRHHTDDARFLELLERWLTGAFNHADERELHALAASDDFRRETWEGFSALPETLHQIYLQQLRDRLRAKSGAKRVFIGMWMAAAAALVLVLAAVFFWPEPPGSDEHPVAQTTDAVPAPPNKKPAPPEDSHSDLADTYSKTKPSAPSSGPAAALPRSEPANGPTDMSQQDDFVSVENGEAESKRAESAPATAFDTGTTQKAETETLAQTQPTEPPSGAQKKIAEKPAGTENAKATGAAPVRKADEKARTKDLAQPAATTPAAEPDGGWDSFQQYLRRNARLTEAARNNNISGTVRLQFSIGTDGKPANIQVLQSIGFGCDEEAKRLVRAFQWAPAGGNTIVEVPFVR